MRESNKTSNHDGHSDCDADQEAAADPEREASRCRHCCRSGLKRFSHCSGALGEQESFVKINYTMCKIKLQGAKITIVATRKVPCKRPYSLGKRQVSSDLTRARVLGAARRMLESQGFLSFTLDGLARESGVTRQTIHNLFRTKSGVIEALFDQLAISGGMERMPFVMQQTDARAMLAGFVEIFVGFWQKDRMFLRRIHGIAAIDPAFGAAVAARNLRRKSAAIRVVGLLGKDGARNDTEQKIHTLHALTSFEFYDALVEACGNEEHAAKALCGIVEKALL